MVHARTKIIAGISGAAFICSTLVLGVVVAKLYFFHEELHSVAQETNAAIEKERALISLERLVTETEEERTELSGIILTEDRVVDFLAVIEGIGAGLGLDSKTNSLTVIPGKTNIEDISMNVTLEGPEKSVLRALRMLEALPYRSSLERLTLVRKEEGGDVWTATVEVRVAKYKNS